MRQSRAPRGATRMEDAARHIKGVKSVDGDADNFLIKGKTIQETLEFVFGSGSRTGSESSEKEQEEAE